MRTPSEAIAQILGSIRPLADTQYVPLEAAAGRVLAEPVVSDVDLPPFEKSAMDGFAVRAADFGPPARDASEGAGPVLRCVGESRAGEPFRGAVPAGTCVEIYTGAEVPADCDAVVMIEETQREEGGEPVRFPASVRLGQNINHRAEILATGRGVLEVGKRLTAADLAVLAAVGCDPVPVFRRPRVSILTTGDELVAPSATPGAGQIREGNTYYLRASAAAAGCELLACGRVADSLEQLQSEFETALAGGDALITCGGVSMGKYDLVGAALEAVGVTPVLHKVAIKPGKPIWFGHRRDVPVFGLPGNPVSSMLGFEVFVRPALLKLGGARAADQRAELRHARWTGSDTRPEWREQNVPAAVSEGADGVLELAPVRWLGSADMVGVAAAEVLAVIPPDTAVRAGELVQYRILR